MTSTIGLCVLNSLGSSNVLFLVHFGFMYQKKRPLGCIQITNRCTTNPCKLKHPHGKWAFEMHFNGQYTYIYSCKFKHPHKQSSWRAFNSLIYVGSYYKLIEPLDKANASYLYNVNKILSQFDNFQHLSMFDAWWWKFRRFFLMKGSFTIWVPKKGIKIPTSLEASF
jgi:hypothetical protein